MSSSEILDIRQLVDRCLEGDQTSMQELIGRYRGRVFALCYKMLGHLQDAEDTVQETFFRVAKSLARWDSTRDFEPWLLAIAGNRCRTLLAKRCKRPAHEPLIEEQLADDGPDLQAAEILAEEVRLALRGLRMEYRRAFILFHDHEMSYAEIAGEMQCPLGTVKTWVHRARRELIACLQERGVVGDAPHAVHSV